MRNDFFPQVPRFFSKKMGAALAHHAGLWYNRIELVYFTLSGNEVQYAKDPHF